MRPCRWPTVQPPWSGCQAKARLLTSSHASSSRPGSNGARRGRWARRSGSGRRSWCNRRTSDESAARPRRVGWSSVAPSQPPPRPPVRRSLSGSTPRRRERSARSTIARARLPSPSDGSPLPRRRPRTPKGRARGRVRAAWPRSTPTRVCELDHRNAFELLAATILSAQCTDDRVNMVTPELFRRYPTPRGPRRRRPGGGRGDHPLDRVLQEQDQEPHRHGQRAGRALRRRGAARDDGPGHAPGRRPQDRQRGAQRGARICPACRSTPTSLRLSHRLGLTTEDDPVKVELELNPWSRRGAGRVQPAADPARTAGVRRPQAALRRVRAGRFCPSVPV